MRSVVCMATSEKLVLMFGVGLALNAKPATVLPPDFGQLLPAFLTLAEALLRFCGVSLRFAASKRVFDFKSGLRYIDVIHWLAPFLRLAEPSPYG